MFIETLDVQMQAIALNGFDVLWSCGQHDIVTRACKHTAIIAAYRTRIYDGDFHFSLLL